MALNPFFLHGTSSEQFLVQDLINEHIRMFGMEVTYIPRKMIDTDDVFNEVQSSKFDDNFILEAYLNNYEGHTGQGDLMTKFGISLRDEITLTISKERFEDFISPFLMGRLDSSESSDSYDDGATVKISSRPKEGDLIYFPLSSRLFEIKFVEHESPFYQLNKNYTYELKCELFEYEDEIIDTNITDIDELIDDQGYLVDLTLVSAGTTATATANIGTGYIREIFLNDDGYNYTSAPNITITAAPDNGTNATAVATLKTVSGRKTIDQILLTNAGAGYTVAPTITINGGGGTGAAATCSIGVGSTGVISLTVTDDGSGYITAPTVTIDSPIGPGAAATASISGLGTVNGVTVTNGGEFYSQSNPPTVTFSAPTGGGNETSIVKFGSRSYKSTGSSITIPTTGVSDLQYGSVGFWFYVSSNYSGIKTIVEFGANDNDTEKYSVSLQESGGTVQAFLKFPLNASSSGTGASTLSTDLTTGEWHFLQLAQIDQAFNSRQIHLDNNSSFATASYKGNIIDDNGFIIDPDESLSDGDVFFDEFYATTVNSEITIPTSTLSGQSGEVYFRGGERVTATGISSVSSAGIVTSVTITNAGTEYTTAPTVSIANTAGNKVFGSELAIATADSVLYSGNLSSRLNTVDSFRIINPGIGYTAAPAVTISDPSVLSGIGTFELGEKVTGGTSGAIGRVRNWNKDDLILRVGNVSGTFTDGEVITGAESGAVYAFKSSTENETINDKYQDNLNIESEADSILDFTEINPFGTY